MTAQVNSGWKIQRIALLSTGSEILQGQYADTNARFLAEQLTLAGLSITTIIAAPDDEAAIERALRFAATAADLVICTGGLGPTRDDVNRFVFERVFKTRLIRDEMAVEKMGRRFLTRGLGPMPEANDVQALLPEGCVPLYNKWGTAPGFLLPPTGASDMGRCGLLALPGPPSEMMPMYRQLALPELTKYLPKKAAGGIRTIHTYGYAESQIGTMVSDLFDPAPGIDFSILAKRHGVDLRIRATKESSKEVTDALDHYENRVRECLEPQMIYGTDDETLMDAVGSLLKKRQAWVTTAESCTGGMVAQFLTEIPGSSAYVGECYVTYSNAAKSRVLGVAAETLKKHGAVSTEIAVEMANGALAKSGADYAISVTGIAGPGGGTPEKPVGLVYICVAGPDDTVVTKNQLLGDRETNRLQSAQIALNMLRLMLLK